MPLPSVPLRCPRAEVWLVCAASRLARDMTIIAIAFRRLFALESESRLPTRAAPPSLASPAVHNELRLCSSAKTPTSRQSRLVRRNFTLDSIWPISTRAPLNNSYTGYPLVRDVIQGMEGSLAQSHLITGSPRFPVRLHPGRTQLID